MPTSSSSTETSQPCQQPSVAGGGRRERFDAEEAAGVVERSGDVDVKVGVDPRGDSQWQGGHRHPFVGKRGGWHHTCRDDGQDSDGPPRQAPSRSLRPTGGCRVAARTRPTDRLEDNPAGGVSRLSWVRPGSSSHPNADRHHHSSGGSSQRPTSSSLPARGSGCSLFSHDEGGQQ